MRKTKAKKRILLADPKHNDILVTRFINNMMEHGKRNTASIIFYDAIDLVGQKTKENGIDVWKKAINNISPQVEVKSRRVGGATFQIPQEVRPNRKVALAFKWLISYATERNGKSMSAKLADEIVAASKEEGAAYKKKEDTHKMAEANKAFAHFRF